MAFYPADVVGVVVMVILICVYIPSACSTMLKYRSGILPSLGSSHFAIYRVAIDTVSVIRSLTSRVVPQLTNVSRCPLMQWSL
jgi:hypothetical protein